MTLTVTDNGQTRTITDIDVVESAFMALGLGKGDVNRDFIAYWLSQGKTVNEILAIAGERPQGKGVAA